MVQGVSYHTLLMCAVQLLSCCTPPMSDVCCSATIHWVLHITIESKVFQRQPLAVESSG